MQNHIDLRACVLRRCLVQGEAAACSQAAGAAAAAEGAAAAELAGLARLAAARALLVMGRDADAAAAAAVSSGSDKVHAQTSTHFT
jgi:hypothetical protein